VILRSSYLRCLRAEWVGRRRWARYKRGSVERLTERGAKDVVGNGEAEAAMQDARARSRWEARPWDRFRERKALECPLLGRGGVWLV
jgi:hypothetical protein